VIVTFQQIITYNNQD